MSDDLGAPDIPDPGDLDNFWRALNTEPPPGTEWRRFADGMCGIWLAVRKDLPKQIGQTSP